MYVFVLLVEEFKGLIEVGFWGDFVNELDMFVGCVFDLVDDFGLDDDIFVFFNVDNGLEMMYVCWMCEDYMYDVVGGW